MSFECHITVSVKDAAAASEVANLLSWKTSQIARDPILGDDTYFYLTEHSKFPRHIFARMDACVAALRERGVHVIREKVELIIHDTKAKNAST